MAAFVTAAVAVRFVFPAVSAEGPAFWIVRTAPVRMSSFLWSKLWTGLRPDPRPGRGDHRDVQPPPRRAPLPEAARRLRHRLHDPRPRGPRLRHGRAAPALRRGEPHPGRRLLRRRRLHGAGRALHPRHGGPPRLARLAVPLARVPRPADRAAPAGLDGAVAPGGPWPSASSPSGSPCEGASGPSRSSARPGRPPRRGGHEPCYDRRSR